MKALLHLSVACIVGVSAIGCGGDTASTKTQTTVKTPGGETTTTVEKKIETTGENPPAPAPAKP
jgi:hypothetical protein